METSNITIEGMTEAEKRICAIVSYAISKLPSKQEDRYKTRHEAGAILRVSLVTVDKLIRDNKITAMRIGGRVLILESSIHAALTEVKIRRNK